jgi:hypothetical protein
MRKPTLRLLLTLGLGWLAFIGLGLGLRQWNTGPTVTVIIDRSYCAPAQWQAQAQRYTDLYDQHDQGRLRIVQVIYVSDLGAVVAETLPTPEEINRLNTFGRFNAAQMEQARQAAPNPEVLSCQGN